MSARPTRLILHQYDTSPFSEKVRKVLAHKGLEWCAVEQPSIMPKPNLLPLTGGYRRIPVLQIDADVYCDSQLVVRVLERLHPSPTIYPAGGEATCHAWNLWADRMLFLPAVSAIFAEIGAMVSQEFIDDRTKMMPGRNFADLPKLAPHAREQLRALLVTLETQLADGRRWILGDDFSLADAATYHPIWFLRVAPGAMAIAERLPSVMAWAERMAALGEGKRTNLDAQEALAIARDATPAMPSSAAHASADPDEPNGLVPGMRVAAVPDDYGFDPVVGALVFSDANEIAIRRIDPDLGELVVHFPRLGFRIDVA